jgi:hypothetical protein
MNVGNWINLGCLIFVVLFFLILRWGDRRAERVRLQRSDDDGMRTESRWFGTATPTTSYVPDPTCKPGEDFDGSGELAMFPQPKMYPEPSEQRFSWRTFWGRR